MKNFLLIFLLLWCAAAVCAEENILTLQEYLQTIVKEDPSYKKIFHEKTSAEAGLLAVKGVYGITVFGNYSRSILDESQFASFKTKEGEEIFYGYGANKKFEETGTDLSLQFLRHDSKTTYEAKPEDLEVVSLKPATVMRVTQPLWQDFMGTLTRMPVERMKLQQEVALMTEQENAENYYEEAICLYYDWLSLTLALDPLIESYKNSQILLKEVEAQYKNDVALKTDLIRSQEAVLMYKNALEETLYNWNQVGAELFKKMNRSFKPAVDWEKLPLKPHFEDELFSAGAAVQDVVQTRPVEIMDTLLSQIEIQVEESKRAALPKMSVYAEATDYKIEDEGTESFSRLNNRDTKVGVDFSVYLDNAALAGAVVQLEEQLARAREELEATKKSLETLYKNYVHKVSVWEKLQKNAKSISDYTKERLSLETKRYQNGKTMLREVSDTRTQYIANRTAYDSKLVEMAKLKLSLASLNDELYAKVAGAIK